MAFSAEQLHLFMDSDKRFHDSMVHHVKMMRSTVDIAASEAAKANREWHDDPTTEDHAEFHAPSIEQYPREVRDSVVRMFVEYWLAEFTIQEEQA